MEAEAVQEGGDWGVAAISLARECARAAQRGGTPAAAGRWTGGCGRPCGWRCRRPRARRRAEWRHNLSGRWHSGRVHFTRPDSERAKELRADDGHSQGAGAGTEPSLYKVPGAGDRFRGDEERGWGRV